MPWLVGRKATNSLALPQAIIDLTGAVPDPLLDDSIATRIVAATGLPENYTIKGLKFGIVNNNGGVEADYSFKQITTAEAARINKNDLHTVVWVNDEIDSVDFSAEEAKTKLIFAASKSVVDADIDGMGTDSVTITITAVEADGVTVVPINATGLLMPVHTPDGVVNVKVNVTAGVASTVFKPKKTGFWTFPHRGKKNSIYTVLGEAVTIEAIDPTIWDS